MGVSAPPQSSVMSSSALANGKVPFVPRAVTNFEEAGLSPAMIEGLVLKFLVNTGMASGRQIAAELGLPFGPFPEFLRQLKNQQILTYANSATANDFRLFADRFRSDARQALLRRMYLRRDRPGPVRRLSGSVAAQTITSEHPKEADLRRAFSDLLISDDIFAMLGPAINSGRGMFLYGYPGNGKTSIAERITRCFDTTRLDSQGILFVEGQIIKLFDMANHEPIEVEQLGRPARRYRLRPPLGADPTPDHRRRGRVEDAGPRDPLRLRDQDQRSPAAAQEQPRHLLDRRFRPPADAADRTARTAGSSRWKSGTTSSASPTARRSAFRSTNSSSSRPTSSPEPGRRGLPPANPVQDRRDRSRPRRCSAR